MRPTAPTKSQMSGWVLGGMGREGGCIGHKHVEDSMRIDLLILFSYYLSIAR